MEQGIDTGLRDKSNRMIHIGDTLQHRLGVNGRSSGPTRFVVYLRHSKCLTRLENELETEYGIELKDRNLDHCVVVDCIHIPS